MTRHLYSRWTIEEHIERDQRARAARVNAQRSASLEWRLVNADDGLPGLAWERVKRED